MSRTNQQIEEAVQELQDRIGLHHAEDLIAWCEDPDLTNVSRNASEQVMFWYGYLRGQADAQHTTAASLARAVLRERKPSASAHPRFNPDPNRHDLWLIAAHHAVFGTEGKSEYAGTKIGARRAALKIARSMGHGWKPLIARRRDAPDGSYTYEIERD
jgi:hypothetical protein